jgi:methylated-DNA-[protein]-cysteine S-methyltransferase
MTSQSKASERLLLMTNLDPDSRPIEERLRDATIDPDLWREMTAELARRADAQELLDVAFERHDSPLGRILVAATREGVVCVGLPLDDEEALLEDLARRVSARILRAPRAAVTAARGQLDEYFERRRTDFDVPLDWRLTRGFRRQVLEATAAIPYGETASYAQVAANAGSPRAVRAAGTALATNPLPILVPCHRVLRSGGAMGNYRGGAEAKAQLIALEGGKR